MKLLSIAAACLSLVCSQELSSELVAKGFSKPVYATALPGQQGCILVLEQKGVIKVIKDGKVLRSAFLNIADRVHYPLSPGDERGLMGLAFHPNYRTNGYLYVNYVDENDVTHVSRFSITDNPLKADPRSELVLIALEQPFSNHNGGHLDFSPKDGFLYISVGDGGKFGDPFDHAQNPETLFGAILRIDVDSRDPYKIPADNPFLESDGAAPEIWAIGLRNVWRFSFDRKTGDLYMGDVGQNKWEEINFQPAHSSGGENYGWRIMEANHCYNPEADCDQSGLVMPILEYPNDANYMRVLTGMEEPNVDGCSVTGGYVYRGAAIPNFEGIYFFADYCSGNIWTFEEQNGKAMHFANRTDEIALGGGDFTTYISSFGEDENGELLIVDYNGAVYRIIPSL